MARLFQLLAVVLAGIAAYFLWTAQAEAAFVTVSLGVVSFFLGVRVEMKEKNRVHEAERELDEAVDEESNSDSPSS